MLRTNDKCLLTELADGTGVVLHLDTKFYYTLNVTGVAVWKAIAAGRDTEAALAEHLVAEFDVERATAEADLALVLRTMLDEGLVHSSSR
ncbi:MAG TPA: PqqD family protein [Polyangiaceae bacterium]|jgi:hypothetical protein